MVIKNLLFIAEETCKYSTGMKSETGTVPGDFIMGMCDIDRDACEEYKACRVFGNDNADEFAVKLNKYLCYDDSYGAEEFSAKTDRLGVTRVFRAYLREFIKEFKPVLIPGAGDTWLFLEKNGEFKAKKRCKDAFKDITLKDAAKDAFRFLCFMKVNEFWEGAEELRGPESPRWPLFYPVIPAGNTPDRKAKAEMMENIKASPLPSLFLFFPPVDSVPFMGHN